MSNPICSLYWHTEGNSETSKTASYSDPREAFQHRLKLLQRASNVFWPRCDPYWHSHESAQNAEDPDFLSAPTAEKQEQNSCVRQYSIPLEQLETTCAERKTLNLNWMSHFYRVQYWQCFTAAPLVSISRRSFALTGKLQFIINTFWVSERGNEVVYYNSFWKWATVRQPLDIPNNGTSRMFREKYASIIAAYNCDSFLSVWFYLLSQYAGWCDELTCSGWVHSPYCSTHCPSLGSGHALDLDLLGTESPQHCSDTQPGYGRIPDEEREQKIRDGQPSHKDPWVVFTFISYSLVSLLCWGDFKITRLSSTSHHRWPIGVKQAKF